MPPHARETSRKFLRLTASEWLAIIVTPVYALILDIGALLGAASIGFPKSSRPNIFIGFISVVPLVFMGLPLQSLWTRGWRTVPALAVLFAGHLAFGLNVALILWVLGPTPWPFHRCATIFPSVSFAVLAGGWLGAACLRSEPSTANSRLALVASASVVGAAVVGLTIGPSIIYLVIAALNAWRGSTGAS